MSDILNIKLGAPIEYGYLGINRRLDLFLKYIVRNGKILDIGCGNGAQTIKLLKYVDMCIAIDIEKNRLETFRQKLKSLKIRNCKIKQMDATKLKFQDEFFDNIICIETLEHIPDQIKTLNEINRVLKKDGLLIMSVPNKWWIFETHGASLPLLPWNRVPFFSWLPEKVHDKYAHARIYTRKEIVKLVENAGFKILDFDYLMPPLDRLENKLIKKIFRKILFRLEKTQFRFFGVSIFVYAKKI